MEASKATSMSRTLLSSFWNCRGFGAGGTGGAQGKTQGAEGGGVDLPQAEVAVPRRLGRDDARAQQHWPDRVHPHRGRVQHRHTLNTCVGHDQLADRQAETLDQERDVLVHLRVANSESDGVEGWEADVVPARM